VKTEAELKREIDRWVQKCIAFIEKGDRKEVQKQIRTRDRNRVDACVGQPCPTCNISLTKRGVNPQRSTGVTAEHIVPRTFGGDNTSDNIIAMCHECNENRNRTMSQFFDDHGGMYGRNLSSDESDQVARFVEWCLRTIHSPESSRIDSELTTLSVRLRMDSRKKKEKRATKSTKKTPRRRRKERPAPSETSQNEVVELLKRILKTQQDILEQLQISFIRRFLRRLKTWLTPRKKTEEEIERIRTLRDKRARRSTRRVRSRRSVARNSKKKTQPSPVEASHVAPNTVQIEPRAEADFIETIKTLLEGGEKILIVQLGNRLKSLLQSEGYTDYSTRAFLAAHGLSMSRGLLNTILKLMPEQVDVTGTHPEQYIQLKSSEQPVSRDENGASITILQAEGGDIDLFRKYAVGTIHEPMSMSKFGFGLVKVIRGNGFTGMTAKQFAAYCGLPTSWSLQKIIVTHLSDDIELTGDRVNPTLSLK
jgi:hypothetical protein